jgi:acyl-coenzyme A thioesterase PaaI-like protein
MGKRGGRSKHMPMGFDAKRLKAMGPSALIREGWQKLHGWPGGSRLFDRVLGAAIPYTGALGAEVVTLERGFARVRLRERRGVRNHLRSIHAIALANLAELTGNLALAYSLPDSSRFIVTGLSIEYKKKARGVVEATCRCDPPSTIHRQEYELQVAIRDSADAIVSTALIKTLVSPLP